MQTKFLSKNRIQNCISYFQIYKLKIYSNKSFALMFRQINRCKLMHIFLVILAFQQAYSYTLDGSWNLQPSSLNETVTDTNIQFQFRKMLDSNNEIVYQFTVTTCRAMFYTYKFQQNTFTPLFMRFGNNTRGCADNQVNYIRSHLEGVFYFIIKGNKLTFVYPSQQTAFVFYKNGTSIPQGIQGQWETISVNGKNISQNISISQNDMILCNNNANLSYSLNGNNTIQVGQNSVNSSCNSNEVVQTLLNSQYYLRQGNNLKLYSNGVQVILTAKNAVVIPTYQSISSEAIQNKWYIHSINGSTLVDSYYYYFLIITADRFRFYGGCHVQFSFYNLTEGYKVSHTKVNYVNQGSDCRYINDDLAVLGDLFNRGKYLTYDSNTKLLSFFDDSSNSVMQFSTQVPKTQDIFPPSSIA